MPFYQFKNKDTGEVRDIFFHMQDVKEYKGENGDEEWVRVFTAPNMSLDTRIDPFSAKDFAKKTQDVKTYGQAWDRSKEFSEMRASKVGAEDPVLKKAEKEFYQPKKKRINKNEKSK